MLKNINLPIALLAVGLLFALGRGGLRRGSLLSVAENGEGRGGDGGG